ncbi:MAG TPA: hypothetical protein VFP91_04430, partial [Vicinamibacterales bacterium]|nr:hypothetical protein [Vicinamibacterales bacterium]
MRFPVDRSNLPPRSAHLRRRPSTDRSAYHANNGRTSRIPQPAARAGVVAALGIVVALAVLAPRAARAD